MKTLRHNLIAALKVLTGDVIDFGTKQKLTEEEVEDIVEKNEEIPKPDKYKDRYPGANRNLSYHDIDRLDELYYLLNRSARDDSHWDKTEKEIDKLLGI